MHTAMDRSGSGDSVDSATLAYTGMMERSDSTESDRSMSSVKRRAKAALSRYKHQRRQRPPAEA